MAAKRASSKRKGGKKKVAKKMVAKVGKMPTIKDPLSKGGIIRALTDMTCLAKKDVTSMLENLNKLIELHIRSKGPGKFVMPGAFKITVVKKPARPARKGINPFTGEEVMFKAKPAHKVVKIKALKKLKEVAA